MTERIVNKPQLRLYKMCFFTFTDQSKYFISDNLEQEKRLRFKEELVHNSKDAKGWWVHGHARREEGSNRYR